MPAQWTQANGYGLYDPTLPITRFPIDDIPDITAADAATEIFPVTREELLAYHHALVAFDKQVNSLPPGAAKGEVTTVMKPGGHMAACREFSTRFAPSPACALLSTRLGWELASYGPAGQRYWPQPRRLWLEDIPWIRSFQETFREVYDLQAVYIETKEREKAGYGTISGDGDIMMHANMVWLCLDPAAKYRIQRRITLALMRIDPESVNPDKVSPDESWRGAKGIRAYIGRWLKGLSGIAVSEAGDDARRDSWQILYEWSHNPAFNGPPQPRLESEALVALWPMLPENDFIRLLLGSPEAMSDFTNPEPVKTGQWYAAAPGLREVVERVAGRAVEVETAEAGEEGSALADLATSVRSIVGAERFAACAAALQKGPDMADATWCQTAAPDGTTPRQRMGNRAKWKVMRSLLHSCRPAPKDNAETLRRAMEARGVSAERLREAARQAPKWQALAAEVEKT